ncbi:MAG: ankyrin repeat domain-containing protein, partial [Endomicrobiaceae bacterium]|nr:ankyrin repeat domain-containing protein [Endomicrobiaceae bacterium]
LNKKADVNDIDVKGNTPLMYAVMAGNLGVVEALVDLKADVSIKNKEGLTAQDLTKLYPENEKYIEINKYFQELQNPQEKVTSKKKKKKTTTK